MVLSKAIGGSLPLAVIVYRDDLDVWRARRPRRHLPRQPARHGRGHGHPRLRPRERPRRTRRDARRAHARSTPGTCARSSPCIGDVRGRGLMIGDRARRPAEAEPPHRLTGRERAVRAPARAGARTRRRRPAGVPPSRPDRRTRRPPRARRPAAPSADDHRRTGDRGPRPPRRRAGDSGPHHTHGDQAPQQRRRTGRAPREHVPPRSPPSADPLPARPGPPRTLPTSQNHPRKHRLERHPRIRRPCPPPHSRRRGSREWPSDRGETVPPTGRAPSPTSGCAAPPPDLLEHPDPHTAPTAAAVGEPAPLLGTRERPPRTRRRHPAHPPPRQRHRPARPRPLLVPDGLAPLRPPYLADAPDHAPPADAVTVAALLTRESPTADTTLHRQRTGPAATDAPPPAARLSPPRPAPVPTWSAGSPTPSGAPPPSSPSAAKHPARRRVRPLPRRRAVPAPRPPAAPHPQEPRRPLRSRSAALLTRVARLLPPALDGRGPLRARHRLGLDRARPPRPRRASSPPASPAPACRCPTGHAALPLHPWQAARGPAPPRDRRPARRRDSSSDLGPHGPPWHPTSSVRTVHRPGAARHAEAVAGPAHHQLPPGEPPQGTPPRRRGPPAAAQRPRRAVAGGPPGLRHRPRPRLARRRRARTAAPSPGST